MADKRLYVGDLPNDTTVQDLQKFFKKYGVTTVELKKKPGVVQESTFAYINVSADRVDSCLQKCKSKNFKNTALKIEIAKESFLERLKKERDKRNDKKTSENSYSNFPLLGNVARKNKKIVFADDNDDEFNRSESNFSENVVSPSSSKPKKRKFSAKNFQADEKVEEIHHSVEEIPRKRNLPMFRGTALISVAEEQKTDCSMKRFEAFSDVWRDSSPERNYKESRKVQWRQKELNVDIPESKIASPSKSNTMKSNSKNTAELKRLNALQEKWNVIKEKKETIRKALKNLEFGRKKTFTEVDEENNDIEENSGKKIVLFEDDAFDDDFQPNFDVKEHLTGKNGLKILKLKSQLSNDERFKLDDRFYEDTDTLDDSKVNQLINENEQRKELFNHRSMVRFDPDKANHKVGEKEHSKNKASEKNKKTKKKANKKHVIEGIVEKSVTQKPEVSKEKHYSVTDSLKDAFKKTDDKASFSLSAMFDEKIQKDNTKCVKNRDAEAVPLKKLKTIENPFENASTSDGEDEEVTIDEEPLNVRLDPVPSEKILGKCGVWGETFFFKPNDSRLQEAVSFYRVSSKPKQVDFNKTRTKLRGIVRKKLQNSRRDKKLFKQKLGGKLNKVKFLKRLKKAHS